MKFSHRAQWSTESNALSALLAAKRIRGETILDLTESNPTRCGFKYADARWLAPFSDLANLKYDPDPRGLLSAREAVCAYYAERGLRVAPDRVFLTSGTSEAYSHLLRLLTDPGDTVAVPAPGYPLFDFILELNDVLPSRYRSVYEKGSWKLDTASLKEACAGHPKAVIVVNPNNPTGRFVDLSEHAAMNRLCHRAGAAIISDEVFLDFAIDGKGAGACLPVGRHSLAANAETLTFTLSGVSKVLGLPQVKLSWIVVSGPEVLAKTACEKLEFITDTYLSVSTPIQRALPAWLKHSSEAIGEISARVNANRKYLQDTLKDSSAVKLLASEGGWYAILEYPGVEDDEAFALSLLQKHNVFVHPGYFFDLEGSDYLVLSLLPEEGMFQSAAQALLDACV
jgi:hypothetical protein